MFSQTYYWALIRTYIIYFGSLFKDIYINRFDANNNFVETMQIPLSYGPKEKFLARVNADPKLDRTIAIDLPRLAFEHTAFQYDGDRKLNTIGINVNRMNESDKIFYQYNPVPYNIYFSLYLMVRNAEDGAKILEQILPYFTPEWTASLNLISANTMNIQRDIPIVIQSVTSEDTYDQGDFTKRRTLTWTLNFEMQTYFFGPALEGQLIKNIYINMHQVEPGYDVTTNTYIGPYCISANVVNSVPTTEYIFVQPGLTANGQPTSNSAQTIPVANITSESNYGYIIDFISNN